MCASGFPGSDCSLQLLAAYEAAAVNASVPTALPGASTVGVAFNIVTGSVLEATPVFAVGFKSGSTIDVRSTRWVACDLDGVPLSVLVVGWCFERE